MKWIKENKEVLFFAKNHELISLSQKDLKYLQILAKSNDRKRSRICSHGNIDDDIHEMFIYHPKGTYVRPHKHVVNKESFHLICGKIDFVKFDKIGNITEVIPMGDYISGKTFYYRISSDIFHTQIFLEDTIFHEVTKGPFKKEDTVFADWSPDEKDTALVDNYLIKIKKYST